MAKKPVAKKTGRTVKKPVLQKLKQESVVSESEIREAHTVKSKEKREQKVA